ncbi:MAG: PEGA domain-containing protein [Kofleriaceae bacterium]|nr:PEGA domain-containing protein [Kofleriaceae bacterium]
MCIATRCTSVEQFIQMFHRFVDEESFFVSTLNTRPPGLETSFSVQLADGTPVLRGLCVVMQSWTNASNPFKTPGVRLGIKRLTANSMTVFEQLLVTRSATALPKPKMLPASTPPPVAPSPVPLATPKEIGRVATQPLTARPLKPPPPIPKITPLKPIPEPVPAPVEPQFESAPTKIAAELERDVKTTVKADEPKAEPERDTKTDLEPARAETVVTPPPEETRTPGSDLVLPANPLMNLSDESLGGYVDCTLYEETGNFFPADDPTNFVDDVVPPPLLAPRPAIARMSGPIEVAVSRMSAPIEVPPLPTYVSYAPPTTIPPPLSEAPTGTTIPPPLSPTPQPFATYSPPTTTQDALPPPPIAQPTIPPPIAQATIPPPIAVAADPRLDLEPRARRRPRVWVIAGIGATAALALTILLVSKDKTSNAAPVQDKPEVRNMVAQADPPKPEPAVAETPANPGPADEEPPASEGPPVVGSGPCKVAVTSTPAGSMVSVDGNSMGPSPITIATECGKRKIAVEHARYLTATKFASLEEGTPGSLDVTLIRPTHAVSITSQPSGATVFIDGRRAGTTPTVINVMGFQNLNLEVKKAGFQTTVTKLYSKKPQDKVSIRLARW